MIYFCVYVKKKLGTILKCSYITKILPIAYDIFYKRQPDLSP